jgi:hypothetical protein
VERLGHAFGHEASGFVTSAPVTGAIVALFGNRWTDPIFASFSEGSNMRNAVSAIAAATTNNHDPIQPTPVTIAV